MGLHKREEKELSILERLHKELYELSFFQLKIDILNSGYVFLLEKDRNQGKITFLKGSIIEILDKYSKGKGYPKIKFTITLNNIKESYDWSGNIFVKIFFPEDFSNESRRLIKIKSLEDKINKEKNKTKKNNLYNKSEPVKEEVKKILGLVSVLKKGFKKFASKQKK